MVCSDLCDHGLQPANHGCDEGQQMLLFCFTITEKNLVSSVDNDLPFYHQLCLFSIASYDNTPPMA